MKLIAHLTKRRIAAVAAVFFVSSSFLFAQTPPFVASDQSNRSEFNLLVLGDSILWGQGLKEEHKSWYQVKSWLQTTLGRDVRAKIMAHSGAVIGPAETQPSSSATVLDGEVNSPWPTVNDEIDSARQSYSVPSQVDLVLMDGCINDVNALRFLNAANTPDGLRELAQAKCGAPVEALLRKVASTFTSAHVIVTGYYPVFSEKTSNSLLMKIIARVFYQPGQQATKLPGRQLRERLIAVSGAWYEASNKALADAVNKSNAELAAKSSRQRVLFAKIPFPPEYSFSAPETRLWGFDASFLRKILALLTLGKVSLRTNDEIRSQRIASCNKVYRRPANETRDQKNLRERRRMLCAYASLGHPNSKGAVVYTESITNRLKSLMSETGWLRDQQVARPAVP